MKETYAQQRQRILADILSGMSIRKISKRHKGVPYITIQKLILEYPNENKN